MKAYEEIAGVYGRFNVKIKTLYCDGEGAVAAIKSKLELTGVLVETTSKNEHVAEVERCI